MSRVFRHADGRILVDEGVAGGTGGGVTHSFHREATAEEAARFVAAEMPVEDATEEETEGDT